MNNIVNIDENKCTACGLCTEICINNVLNKNDDGKPVVIHNENCKICGHCVSICPKNAITLVDTDINRFKDFNNLEINPEFSENFLSSKRSVRHYKSTPIDKDIIKKLIRVANMAPTAKNSQDRGYVVIQEKEKIKQIEAVVIEELKKLIPTLKFATSKFGRMFIKDKEAINFLTHLKQDASFAVHCYENGKSTIFYDAPCVIMLYSWHNTGLDGDQFAQEHIGLAESYLMFQAHAMGIESCIIGYASSQEKALRKLVNIPKGYKIYSVLTLGYPKYKFRKTVYRKEAEILWY